MKKRLLAGAMAVASYADTFRVYGNNVSQPWVTAGETTVKVDRVEIGRASCRERV